MADTDTRGIIFVFEDSEVMRMLISMHLEQAGYTVRAFEDAVEGGRAMLDSPPDLLICDVDMPFLNGLDLLGVMNSDARSAGVPTIMVTARTDTDSEMTAIRHGAARYMTKPLRREDLLRNVREVLAMKEAGGSRNR